jgi:hypothetical protein
LCGKHVIVLADDSPERGSAEGDVPPSPTNVRSGNDRGASSKETKDVDEKLGWETIDRQQMASQNVKFCHGTFEKCCSFCELYKSDNVLTIVLKGRTSFASTELEISSKQTLRVCGNSKSSERARTRAKRCVSDQSDIAPGIQSSQSITVI